MSYNVIDVKARLRHQWRDIVAGQVGAGHCSHALAMSSAFGGLGSRPLGRSSDIKRMLLSNEQSKPKLQPVEFDRAV